MQRPPGMRRGWALRIDLAARCGCAWHANDFDLSFYFPFLVGAVMHNIGKVMVIYYVFRDMISTNMLVTIAATLIRVFYSANPWGDGI